MFTEAIDCYRKALKLDPEDPRVHNNLGIILASRGELSEATDHYNEALEFFPDSFEIHNNLGVALQSQGRLNEAVEHYRKALDMNPDSAELHNNLAYILVTNPNPTERNVIDAVGHAQRAVELTHYQNSTALNTLAKAYAAAGQFDKAVETAQKALTLASNEGNQNLATQIHNQLQGYEQAKP
jgi:spermidine synthase